MTPPNAALSASACAKLPASSVVPRRDRARALPIPDLTKQRTRLLVCDAFLPIADFLQEARLRVVRRERDDGFLEGHEDEGLLEAALHAGEIEEHLALGLLHHEEQEIAPRVGRDLGDAQHAAALESTLLCFERIFCGVARNAGRVGHIAREIAVAPGFLQPGGDGS